MYCDRSRSYDMSDMLDVLSIHIFTALHDIRIERENLTNNIKEGFINLAKSRYIMTGQEISMLQVNVSNLRSSLKSYSYQSRIEDVECTGFLSEDPNETSDLEDIPKCTIRFTKKKENELTTDLQEMKISSEDSEASDEIAKKETVSPDDPLRWFGVLVPDSLKESQKYFKLAAHSSVKIATLQSELSALCQEYRTLRLKRKETGISK